LARSGSIKSQAGFSLIEVIIATGLMAASIAALGQMFAISVADNKSSRNGTYAAVLAEQKMEQLRGLTWGFDAIGLPLSDFNTNTATAVQTPGGGTGLTPSPSNSLTRNADGYVDYLDQFGRILGGGLIPPPGTVYIRRWSVEPLPTNPNNTLILQVLVTRTRDRGTADTAGSVRRLRDESRLLSVRTRKAQ
jgi:prepilin-type N-terminal cleavage/methylation domain-containing protein